MENAAEIRAKFSGKKSNTAYIALPGHREEAGIVAKTMDLSDVIEGYRGPRVHLDFDSAGTLIGIEILA